MASNKYPATCLRCGEHVAAGAGFFELQSGANRLKRGKWATRCKKCVGMGETPIRGRRLLRVTAPHLCAGAVFEKRDGRWVCIEAAPIIGWMWHMPPNLILERMKQKGYTWIWIK